MGYNETLPKEPMFNRTPKNETPLESALTKALSSLAQETPGTTKYDGILESVTKLHKMKETSSISKDTVAMITANLAGIGLILAHEHTHVIATKALGFVSKLR